MKFKDLKIGDKIYFISKTSHGFKTDIHTVKHIFIKSGYLSIQYEEHIFFCIYIPLHKINADNIMEFKDKYCFTTEKMYLEYLNKQINEIIK